MPGVLAGPIHNRYVYYRAEGGGLVWGEAPNSEGAYFCTTSKKFDLEDDAPCEGAVKRFQKINGGTEIYATYVHRFREGRNNPMAAAVECQRTMSEGLDKFTECWMRKVATVKQRQIIDCFRKNESDAVAVLCSTKGHLGREEERLARCTEEYTKTRSPASFSNCLLDGHLGQSSRDIIRCAIDNPDSMTDIGLCASLGRLSPQQRRLANCITSNTEDYRAAGRCLLALRMSPQQAKIASCVMDNRGSYAQMGVCAFGDDLRLTPEQQAFLECAISSGGQPVSYAGCVGTRLTVNELQKCVNEGVGGPKGCFGKNNTVRQFYENQWKDVTRGPGPNNDIVGRDGALLKAARETEKHLNRVAKEAEKSIGKLIDDPGNAAESFIEQLGCGFC